MAFKKAREYSGGSTRPMRRNTSDAMPPRRPAPKDNTISQALQGITEGLYTLFSRRIDLLHFELVDEARATVRGIAFLMAGVTVALFGYGLLLTAIVLLAAALSGQAWVGALTAALLGAGHLGAGIVAALRGLERLSLHRFDLELSRQEFQRDRQWLKELQTPEASTTETTPLPEPIAVPPSS